MKSMIPTPAVAVAVAVKKMTPNLYAEDVEACIQFWVERLSFEKTVEVPDDTGKLAFAALEKGPIELMYGSYASLKKDAEVSRRSSGARRSCSSKLTTWTQPWPQCRACRLWHQSTRPSTDRLSSR